MITEVANSQIEVLDQNLPQATSEDATKPRMPFKTAYVLTREQEDALVEHACHRMQQIEEQLGKPNAETQTTKTDFQITCDPESFWGKRERYTARYYNHVEDRAKPNTIYHHSNLATSLSQRIAKQMLAKAAAFFFGQPDDNEWFTAEGVGVEDEILADKIKKYGRYKAEKCLVKPRLIQALEFAFVRGEAVVKTTHQERFQIYKRKEIIMIDVAGKPILDAHGDYIVQTDKFVDELAEVEVPLDDVEPPDAAVDPTAESEEPDPAMPMDPVSDPMPPPMVPTGNKVLKRDGVTILPDEGKYAWKEEIVSRKLVTFEGPDARLVYYQDFLCPIDAISVQEADLIAHLFDRTVMEVAQMFSGMFAEGDEGIADFQAAVTALRDMMSESSFSKSAEGQPRADFKETTTEGSPNNPKTQFAECWLTYDADGDGIQEEIMLVVDRRKQVPIFYEYSANVTLRGLRPFDVIRPIEIDGRWYGMGAMEYFDPEQEFIDLQINRKNFRDSAAGRVTFWAPHCTLEGQANPRLKLNHGGTYTLVENRKAEDALSYVTLPENTGDDLMELVELFMQMMQLKGGVINPGDQKMSGLPTSETATGENLIDESGDEMFALFLVTLYCGLAPALANVVDVTFANLNRLQVFTYFNGEANEILELMPEDVRDMALNVRLSITKTRDKQILTSGQTAKDTFDWYYSKSLPLQEKARKLATDELKALKVTGADKMIEPMDPLLALPPVPVDPTAPKDPMAPV